MEITPPAKKSETMIEKPHCGTKPKTAPTSGPQFPALPKHDSFFRGMVLKRLKEQKCGERKMTS